MLTAQSLEGGLQHAQPDIAQQLQSLNEQLSKLAQEASVSDNEDDMNGQPELKETPLGASASDATQAPSMQAGTAYSFQPPASAGMSLVTQRLHFQILLTSIEQAHGCTLAPTLRQRFQ